MVADDWPAGVSLGVQLEFLRPLKNEGLGGDNQSGLVLLRSAVAVDDICLGGMSA